MVRSIKAKVGITYFLLNIISISLFSWVISMNQLELISDNTRYQTNDLINSVVSGIHKMPVLSSVELASPKQQAMALKQVQELIQDVLPNYIIFQDSSVLVNANAKRGLPKNYASQATKAIALYQNSGSEFYIELNQEKSHLDVYIPLDMIGMKSAVLYTRISMKGITDRYQDLYKQIAITIFGITLLHFVFGLFFYKMLVAPLLTLKNSTDKIAKGDYSVRVPVMSEDEIGSLARGFNHMSISLQGAFTQLQNQMTEIKQAQGVIERMAITDELTGLFNRRHFFTYLRGQIAQSVRYNSPLSVILLDLDHFKNFNDHYGHIFGDKVLRELGAIMLRVTRNSDVVARYGGEEVVVLLPETDLKQACVAAEKIREAILSTPIEVAPGHNVQITASLGVAEFTTALKESIRKSADPSTAFIECADKALYHAKNNGRNCIVVYEQRVT